MLVALAEEAEALAADHSSEQVGLAEEAEALQADHSSEQVLVEEAEGEAQGHLSELAADDAPAAQTLGPSLAHKIGIQE